MVTQGPLGATDANFAAQHFHDCYNTDLVNTVGNCASRVTAMIGKYFEGIVPTEIVGGTRRVVGGFDWPAVARDHVARTSEKLEAFDLAGAAAAALALVRQVDGFINATEPFKLAREDSKRDELGAILYQCAEAVRIASLLLWAVMPWKMEELWAALGQRIDPAKPGTQPIDKLAQWGGMKPGTRVTKVALFPRLETPVGA
jgi:methionyl-tRNA synthetase